MKRLVLLAAFAAVLALAGTALATTGLSGKYKEVIKNDSALGGALNGTWVINLTAGHYKATDNGHVVVKGKDTITGNKITLHDKSGSDVCPTPGKYKFKLTGSKLKFTKISDSSTAKCIGRADVLTHGTFKQV